MNNPGYTLVLANPPFKGSLNYDEVAKDLLQVVRTKKTELLFLALFLAQLKPGGRCACIVPEGVLTRVSEAYKDVRRAIIDAEKLDAVVAMPAGVFKPYANVSTAVLLFTRTDSGGTPPLAEQARIASILDGVEAMYAKHEKAIEELAKLRTIFSQRAFRGEL